jgi:pentatricopeptide repeat protein
MMKNGASKYSTLLSLNQKQSWKIKVSGRFHKESLFFLNLKLPSDFPLSEPVHLLRKYELNDESDGNQQVPDKYLHEFNYFAAYNQLKTRKKSFEDGKNLRNLAIQIAHSSILHRDTRLSRFNEVYGMYLHGNNLPDSELFQSFAIAISHTLQNEKDYLAFLLRAKTEFGVTNFNLVIPLIIEGLCLGGSVDLAKSIFMRSNVNQCLSILIETMLSQNRVADVYNLMLRMKKRKGLVLGTWTAHQVLKSLLLLEDRPETNAPQEMVLWILDNMQNPCWSFGLVSILHQLKIKYVDLMTSLGPKLENHILINGYNEDHIIWKGKMDMYLRNGKIDSAYSLQRTEFFLDHIVYNNLIVKMASEALKCTGKNEDEIIRRAQLTAKAHALYVKVKESRLHINLATFNTLLQLFAASGNHKRCRALVWAMHRLSMPVTSEHYYYYIAAYCKVGSVILARSAIEEMIKWKIQPSSRIIERMIKAFLDQQPPNFDKAFVILKSMRGLKLVVNESVIKLFIDSLENQNPTANLELSQIWIRILSSLIQPPPLVYINVMTAALHLNRFDIFDECYQVLYKAISSPDKQAELLLLKSLFLRGKYSQCIKLWTTKKDLLHSIEAYYIMSRVTSKII